MIQTEDTGEEGVEKSGKRPWDSGFWRAIPDKNSKTGGCIIVAGNGPIHLLSDGNAHLIAAAPELYEALLWYVENSHSGMA